MQSRTGSLSIESENMFPIIKKWLYSDHDIFLRELVSNGCDAITKLKKLEIMGEYDMPEDYKAQIQVVVDPDAKTISLTDTGLGMSEEFQKHAFDAFAQEGKQSTTTFSGSGLGLSIVKDIVERMGGTIELESEENVGSTFTVTVPFEIDYLAENNDSQKDSYSQDMDLSGKRVLLVEDNVINMEIAHAILEEEHLNITEAKNGKEAFEIFQNSRLDEYDVIIMDVMMPVMDGLEATKAIRMLEREDAKKIPIIAMTANAFEEDRKACLEAGMNEHIGKPIDIPQLKRVITKLLTKKG